MDFKKKLALFLLFLFVFEIKSLIGLVLDAQVREAGH